MITIATNESEMIITGAHPYYPTLGQVSVTLPILNAPPGPAAVGFRAAKTGNEWAELTSAFVFIGHAEVTEKKAMLGLTWDLLGNPIHPKHRRRKACSFVVVQSDHNRFSIWRPTREMMTTEKTRFAELRENVVSMPDVRARRRGVA